MASRKASRSRVKGRQQGDPSVGYALERSVLDLLRWNRIFCYRQNTGAFQRGERVYWFGTKGAPDVIAVIGGIYIGIECKTGKSVQTKDQRAFQEALQKAGGIYLLVRSIDELQQWLIEYKGKK